jgi:hypothetical protein
VSSSLSSTAAALGEVNVASSTSRCAEYPL